MHVSVRERALEPPRPAFTASSPDLRWVRLRALTCKHAASLHSDAARLACFAKTRRVSLVYMSISWRRSRNDACAAARGEVQEDELCALADLASA